MLKDVPDFLAQERSFPEVPSRNDRVVPCLDEVKPPEGERGMFEGPVHGKSVGTSLPLSVERVLGMVGNGAKAQEGRLLSRQFIFAVV